MDFNNTHAAAVAKSLDGFIGNAQAVMKSKSGQQRVSNRNHWLDAGHRRHHIKELDGVKGLVAEKEVHGTDGNGIGPKLDALRRRKRSKDGSQGTDLVKMASKIHLLNHNVVKHREAVFQPSRVISVRTSDEKDL
jgi:hypothetical protein